MSGPSLNGPARGWDLLRLEVVIEGAAAKLRKMVAIHGEILYAITQLIAWSQAPLLKVTPN